MCLEPVKFPTVAQVTKTELEGLLATQPLRAVTDTLPRNWPEHLDEAVRALNHQILPALKFSPKELLLRLAVNTLPSDLTAVSSSVEERDAAIHMVYAAQQRLDGYEATVRHAITRKKAFDKRVLRQSGEVTFEPGQLVQVYCSNLNYTFKIKRKLLPKWSPPYRIHVCI